MKSNQRLTREKTIRGLKTAWIQCGQEQSERPILFFLHGCPDSPETWEPQITHFEKKFKIIVPFARGLHPSASTKDWRRYTLDAIALDHLEILRSTDPTGEKKIILVGHDLGGPQAWRLAELLKNRLAALILINGPSLKQMASRWNQPKQLLKSWYIAMFQIPIFAEIVLKFWDKKNVAPFLPHYRTAVKTLPKALRSKPSLIQVPTLVLWSNQDPYLDIPSQNEFKELVKNPVIRVLEGHHWIHREDPVHVNRLIENFLEDC